MLQAKDGLIRVLTMACLAVVGFFVAGSAAFADLTIAVPTISTADVATITAWVAGMVVIAVTARFILVNGFVVFRFIGWIVSGAFRWARG